MSLPMSRWSQDWEWGDCFQNEPKVALMEEEFDLLQALERNPGPLFEAPSLGEETSFSDAALSDNFDCSSKNVLEYCHKGMMDDSILPSLMAEETDNNWFINSIFEEQDLVYNDKYLGEAATQPCIKSEHSYSSNNLSPSSPLGLGKGDATDGLQNQSSSLELNQNAQFIHAASTATQPPSIKPESPSHDPLLTAMTSSDTMSTFTHPATIILATTTSSSTASAYSHNGQSVFPTTTVHIKTEPMETFHTLQERTVNLDTVIMPPTPPSSNGSDSDGSTSPQRSAPNSPQRQSPMPQSGVLILSEEEKRTLISEGYPIPSKLPLTKQEEKNLKKVRRKIKNKISAQESRRKKKEYVEQLEKRVEAANSENSDLKKKVESLENNNRTLLGQLHKLQAMLSKVPKTAAASATQTGTVLMVLVLCFAVFLGGSGTGPSSLNVGYSTVGQAPLVFQQPGPLRAQPNMGPGPARAADTADDYTTPNLKSRVLMAFSKEEPDDWCDEYRPLVPWEREESCPTGMEPEPQANDPSGPADPGVDNVMPVVPHTLGKEDGEQQSMAVVTIAVGAKNNDSQTTDIEDYQAMMHPDIAVAPTLGRGNFSAELETA